MPEVNTDGVEGEPFLTPDGCELFFSGDSREGWNLYRTILDPSCL